MPKMSKEEYQRLRSVALKRMKSLQKAGLSGTLRRNYAYGKSFPSYSKLKGNARKLTKAARQLEAFIAAKGSTVSGAREIQKNTLKAIDAVTDTGWRKATPAERAIFEKKTESFGLFMKAAKQAMGDAAFDSDRAVTAFKLAEKNGLDPDKIGKAFKEWQAHNVDKKIQKRKTQVTDEQLERMLSGDVGNNRFSKRERRNAKAAVGRSAGRAESRAQKKKRK